MITQSKLLYPKTNFNDLKLNFIPGHESLLILKRENISISYRPSIKLYQAPNKFYILLDAYETLTNENISKKTIIIEGSTSSTIKFNVEGDTGEITEIELPEIPTKNRWCYILKSDGNQNSYSIKNVFFEEDSDPRLYVETCTEYLGKSVIEFFKNKGWGNINLHIVTHEQKASNH